jgi:tetratricopeptide (TPR) repeat protein
MAAFEELATLMTLFRHLFTIILPYLTHSAQNEYAMSLAHIMMASHDIIGWGETNHIRRVLQVSFFLRKVGYYSETKLSQYLYQVKNATFNNPTVSRFMFFTLMRLGGLEEAKYALRSYLDLIGVPDFDRDIILEDTTSIEDAREASNNHDAEERNSTTDIAPLFSTRAKAQSIVQRLAECADESIESVTQVLLAGVYLYGHEEQHGELAAYLSDLGLDLLILLEQTGSLIVNMFRARGTSYSLLASRCVDPQDRAAHHQTAIASLQKAVDLDNTCWKSFYCLGLQQALMRDAHTAIKSVCKSIELNPHHISSWHLLALLYSCKRTDNINKAIQTLEAGLSIYNSQALHSINGIPVFSWTQGEINASDLFETAEAYLSMRMSQLSLKEALEGPESVLDQYADLFTTYSQITQQLGLLGAPVTSSPAAIDDTVSESTNGGKSRRKSSISLIRRTSFSSIANSITGGGSSSGSIHSTNTQGRPRASSVEESKDSKRPPSSMIRRAESDTDDISDDSQISRRSSFSRKQKTRSPNPIKPRSNSTSVQQDAVELKKRSLQLIDLGLARRIGTAAANSPQHAVGQGSTRSLLTPMTEGSNGAVSLASLLTPSYSMGSLRSNSVGSRSSSTLLNGRVVTRDGLMVSTFHQHHQAFEIRKKTRWHSLLVTLWIMSTKTYIKAGLLEEANKALSEAEHLGLGDPNVWYQLGQLSLEVRTLLEQKSMVEEAAMIREMKQVAWDAFEKALILDPDHIPSQVAKATRLLEDQQVDLADGLLEHSILGLGWDSSEAWYAHAQVKKQQGQWDRVKTCLLFALELTDTQPVRDLAVLPKFIM